MRGGGGLQNGVPVVYHPFMPAVHVPGNLYWYVISKVHRDLPALGTPDTMMTEVTGTLAGALRALTRAGCQLDDSDDRASR